MSRTIGTKRPRNSPIGDYETLCDLCGIAYLRSALVRDEQQLLKCRDCWSERCEVELNRLNALAGRQPTRSGQPRDGGNWDHLYDPPAEVEI